MSECTPQIEFSKAVYYPGEEITGRAWISPKKDLTARKVTITFTGKTVTAWSGKNPIKTPGAKNKKAEDVHFQISHEVWEPENENNVFPSGDYEWNFSFELPKECPASFEGKFGFIRYSVLVDIDVPNVKNNINKVEGAVTVSPKLNLNEIQGAGSMVRKQIEAVTQLCGCLPLNCGPFKKGTVLFTLLTPNLGYVSGEVISLTALIENHSSKAIRAVEGSFNRLVTYRVDTSKRGVKQDGKRVDDNKNCKKEVHSLLVQKEDLHIPAGQSKEITFILPIPPVVSSIKNSEFLSVEYFVRVSAKLDGLSCSDPKADANVIIGNVPLTSEEGARVETYIDVEPAKCWSGYMKPAFVPQVPYFKG